MKYIYLIAAYIISLPFCTSYAATTSVSFNTHTCATQLASKIDKACNSAAKHQREWTSDAIANQICAEGTANLDTKESFTTYALLDDCPGGDPNKPTRSGWACEFKVNHHMEVTVKVIHQQKCQ